MDFAICITIPICVKQILIHITSKQKNLFIFSRSYLLYFFIHFNVFVSQISVEQIIRYYLRIFLKSYLLLIASTGSILAALDAGKMPANTPTIKQIITVAIKSGILTKTGKSNSFENTRVSI